jgi:H+/Cl- antiporter ClcA
LADDLCITTTLIEILLQDSRNTHATGNWHLTGIIVKAASVEEQNIVGNVAYVRLLLWVVILAIPVALLTVFFLWLYQQSIYLYEGLPETLGISPALFTILAGTLGGLLVGLGLRYLGGQHGGSLQEDMAEGKVPYRGLAGSMLVALVGLGSGASVGPEGPLAHMGAGLGSWLAERRGFAADKARILSLSGIAAAFGGFLGTPMSAAFMSLEFTRLLTTPIYANMVASLVAALIGAWAVYTVSGALPTGAANFPQGGLLRLSGLIYAIFFGLVGLAWAFLFKAVFGSVKRLAAPLDRSPLLKPVIGGFLFALVGAWLPLTLFSGEHELAEILATGAELGVFTLILLAVLKLVTLSVCLATGFPGGFVFPLFFSAGALGYALHLLLPFIPLPVCIVGMLAGIGGGVMRMPFAVILLLVVLGNPTLLPVATLSAVTSFLAASILDAGSARKALRQAVVDRVETYDGRRDA